MKSLFEKMGGIYRQVGDYFIPNLILPDDSDYQIGKYGRLRRNYLKEHRKILYSAFCLRSTQKITDLRMSYSLLTMATPAQTSSALPGNRLLT